MGALHQYSKCISCGKVVEDGQRSFDATGCSMSECLSCENNANKNTSFSAPNMMSPDQFKANTKRILDNAEAIIKKYDIPEDIANQYRDDILSKTVADGFRGFPNLDLSKSKMIDVEYYSSMTEEDILMKYIGETINSDESTKKIKDNSGDYRF